MDILGQGLEALCVFEDTNIAPGQVGGHGVFVGTHLEG